MRQITIILADPAGALVKIASLLGDAGVNIESINAEDVSGHGVMQLTVDKYDEAIECLRTAGYPAVSDDAFVIRIADEPGALARVAERFSRAKISIRSIRILGREQGYGLAAVVADDAPAALALVQDLLVTP